MTPPAAELPLAGAALRMTHMTRTAAGRRALRLALLVAGLFALGLLCGERAHAADGLVSTAPTVPTVPTSSSVRLVKPGAPLPVAHSVAHTVTRVTDTVTRTHVTDTVTHADVTDTVAQVGDTVTRVADTVRHVVRPVGDLVETVTGELGQAPPKTLPSLPSQPSLPSLPELPGPPSAPGAGGQVPSAGSGPRHSGAGAVPSMSHAVVRHADAGTVGPTYYGPARLGTDTDGVAVRGEHRGVAPGSGPDRQAPPGDPTGAPGGQAAVDSGTPRHGDPHAVVTPSHRAPLRLVPGAPAAVAAAGTRDRYRDIPLFPG
ncbi:hypothetical protein FNV62_31445 [Streptomyces sp. RLB3-17]|uniref:hypothetical protein n=1 Tax=Streptomyces TaxID=1883 RepID=UPI001163E4CB|nr:MULTISPECIES: hypothetical protein [Streptomyces]MCX5351420.1 hypothetical protein [Streptomyces mirabilis]QDO00268.1 hypothetical protein FNV58_33710 [Streptomyces sp. RLB1-9]QDO10487.1 hypothetical protein FNV68_33565 [Streptomyces sp. S1D4-23]QDO21997.1 hypothetical protein FNV65_32280 [Streptomyces sp. S1A1-8]QDO32123.1 hypothetical protein FNV63_32305 [Streptomyces sp. S1A1-3]